MRTRRETPFTRKAKEVIRAIPQRAGRPEAFSVGAERRRHRTVTRRLEVPAGTDETPIGERSHLAAWLPSPRTAGATVNDSSVGGPENRSTGKPIVP
jgi:hypothetical protein